VDVAYRDNEQCQIDVDTFKIVHVAGSESFFCRTRALQRAREVR
jgi:hypothetical protein